MTDDLLWLDRLIAEQADYYRLTTEQFSRGMIELCEAQEIVENPEIFGPLPDGRINP